MIHLQCWPINVLQLSPGDPRREQCWPVSDITFKSVPESALNQVLNESAIFLVQRQQQAHDQTPSQTCGGSQRHTQRATEDDLPSIGTSPLQLWPQEREITSY